jgi:hypothetical protein
MKLTRWLSQLKAKKCCRKWRRIPLAFILIYKQTLYFKIFFIFVKIIKNIYFLIIFVYVREVKGSDSRKKKKKQLKIIIILIDLFINIK